MSCCTSGKGCGRHGGSSCLIADCDWGAKGHASLLILAIVAAVIAKSQSSLTSTPSVNLQLLQQYDGSTLRPSDFWQFTNVSVFAAAESRRFMIDVAKIGGKNESAAIRERRAKTTAVPLNFSHSNNLPVPSAPPAQFLVVRMISWHPGSECARETCNRSALSPAASAPKLQDDSVQCAVTLSVPPSIAGLRSSDASKAQPVEALLVRAGPGGSSSSSASASATIVWSDAKLSATVSGLGCCGTKLLLGYKIAPALNVCCLSASLLATLTASSSTARTFPPITGQPPTVEPSSARTRVFFTSSLATSSSALNRYFVEQLVEEYTYAFAQDRKLESLSTNGGTAAACNDGRDYEVTIQPVANASPAASKVLFDLLTAPGSRSCRRLCIDGNCSPRLGAFNSSDGRSLVVHYVRRSPTESGECDELEYSGFTLRLLAASVVRFSVSASQVDNVKISEPDWVLIAAVASAALAIVIILILVAAVLAKRRRRLLKSELDTRNVEMQPRANSAKNCKTSCATTTAVGSAHDDDGLNDGDRYATFVGKESGRRATSIHEENIYWNLGVASEGAGLPTDDDHLYAECKQNS